MTVVVTTLALLAATAGEFAYQPVGQLQATAQGYTASDVHVPGMRFPLETAPAFANSQVYGHGGYQGPGGGQCDTENYSYPWWDNYCEPRSWSMPLCPSGTGHQGQDIRPSTCSDDTHWAVATEAGTITHIGSYSVYLTTAVGVRHRYLHLKPSSLQVSIGQSVARGDRIGRVSNTFFDSSGNPVPTTIHVHYDMRMYVASVGGNAYVSPYTSLVQSYEALLGVEAQPCAVLPTGGGTLDDGGPCFARWGAADYWRSVQGAGEGGGLLWTNGWTSDTPSNWARWSVHLETAGKYAVEVSVIAPYNASTAVPYTVRADGTQQSVVLDQSAGSGWRSLGVFSFAAGGDQHVSVYDNTGETAADRHITVDAVRLVPSAIHEPAPEPEPAPVPVPDVPSDENLSLPPEVWTDLGWKDTEGEYLPGVVQAESGWVPVSWFDTGTPARRHEALVAQSIAARTYLLRHLNAQGMSALVPIGPHFQAWAAHAASHDDAAVQDAAGAVLTHEGWITTGNYASGAWPLDASGWPHAPASYGLDQHGTNPSMSWADVAESHAAGSLHDTGDDYSWTWVLLTINDGRTGTSVTPTPQASPGPRNRGSMGQYRSLWMAHTDGWSAADILRYWYGGDIVIEGYDAPAPAPAPAPPDVDAPAAPTGLSPNGLPPQVPPSVTLSWQAVESAEGYEVEVQYLDAGQSWAWYANETTDGATTVTVGLQVVDTYIRWRVRGASPAGWGAWADWAVFGYGAEGAAPSPVPEPPSSPAPGGLTVTPEASNTVVVAWDLVAQATAYDVETELQQGAQWAPYATWSVLAPPLSVWPATSPGTYRVRVRARTVAHTGPWSSWVSFDFESTQVIVTFPDGGDEQVPQDLWPAGTIASGETVTLSWSPVEAASSYEVEVTWLTGGVWSFYATFTPTSSSKTFWPQVDPATYSWRVRRAGGAWSDWVNFDYDTQAQSAGAAAPVDLWPTGNTVVTTESVTMSWAPVAGAAGYAVAIEWAQQGSWESYYTYETSGTSKTFWPQVDKTDYRWRARASIDGEWGSWSGWAEFYFDD